MTREHKHIVIYGAFGLLLGAKLVEVVLGGAGVGIIDWWLLLIGIGAAVVHYSPESKEDEPADDSARERRDEGRERPEDEAEDTLVLRNHPHPQRSRQADGYRATPLRENPDPFV